MAAQENIYRFPEHAEPQVTHAVDFEKRRRESLGLIADAMAKIENPNRPASKGEFIPGIR